MKKDSIRKRGEYILAIVSRRIDRQIEDALEYFPYSFTVYLELFEE